MKLYGHPVGRSRGVIVKDTRLYRPWLVGTGTIERRLSFYSIDRWKGNKLTGTGSKFVRTQTRTH